MFNRLRPHRSNLSSLKDFCFSKFDAEGRYEGLDQGAIPVDCVLHYNSTDSQIINSFGNNTYVFLPSSSISWTVPGVHVCSNWSARFMTRRFPGCVIRRLTACTLVPHSKGNFMPRWGGLLFLRSETDVCSNNLQCNAMQGGGGLPIFGDIITVFLSTLSSSRALGHTI